MEGRWSRFAPLTGVVAVALFVIAGIVGGEGPDFDATGEEVLSFYVDEESSQIAASILAAYGALFLVFFGGALRARLRGREWPSDGLATVAFGGVLLMALGLLAFAGFTFTLADAGDALEPAAAQALNSLNGNFFLPVAVGTAAFLLSAGIAITRGVALPSWLGWIAIVLGIVAITPIGFVAFLGSGIWVLVASVIMALRQARADEPRLASGARTP